MYLAVGTKLDSSLNRLFEMKHLKLTNKYALQVCGCVTAQEYRNMD